MRILFILLFFASLANGQVVDRFTKFSAGDPIDTMDNLVASWREEDIPASDGSAGDWTDRINSFVFVAVGDPQSQSDGSGGREIYYDGVDDAHRVESDPSELNFTPNSDSYTLVVKLGSQSIGSVAKILVKSDGTGFGSYQYGISKQSTVNCYVLTGGDTQIMSSVDVSADDIITVTFDGSTDVELFQNTTSIEVEGLSTGTEENSTSNLCLASRNGGTSAFAEISVKDVLIFDALLDSDDVSFINTNL